MAVGAVVGLVTPAIACGGLVGENGTIQLVRTSTLAAYHDGVERYVTSFEFVGEGKEVGSIVPLPDVPTTVERGGDWTLQRLALEVAPPADFAVSTAAAATEAPAAAEVILETKIDALDITILKGGGDEVGRWALDNGFFLTPDAPEVLDFYASRSPIFMAARFDASRAAALGQQSGDGTPIMLTIPTDQPWVPLRILGLGLRTRSQVIDADVFLLTDDQPQLLAGGSGLTVERSEPRRPAGCSPISGPTRGWNGCPTRCGSPTCGWRPPPVTSTTTWPCPRNEAWRPHRWTPGSSRCRPRRRQCPRPLPQRCPTPGRSMRARSMSLRRPMGGRCGRSGPGRSPVCSRSEPYSRCGAWCVIVERWREGPGRRLVGDPGGLGGRDGWCLPAGPG